jgi:hypothetical protein
VLATAQIGYFGAFCSWALLLDHYDLFSFCIISL